MLAQDITTPVVWTAADIAYHSVRDRGAAGPNDALSWAKQDACLSKMYQLEDGWDGEGARAPSRELVESVAELMRRHRESNRPAPSAIVPTPDGTIFIEWQNPPEFASLEVRIPFEGEWLIEREGYRPEFLVEQWTPACMPAGRSPQWTETRSILPVRFRSSTTTELLCA